MIVSEPRDVSRGPIVVAMCECGHSRLVHQQSAEPKRCMTAFERNKFGNITKKCACSSFAFDEARTRQVSMDNLATALAVEVSNHGGDK